MSAVFVDVFCPLVALHHCLGTGVEEAKTNLRGYCYSNRKKLCGCAEVFDRSWPFVVCPVFCSVSNLMYLSQLDHGLIRL